MAEDFAKLIPANSDDLAHSLAHALQFDGKKRYRASGEAMPKITARHLVEHLETCGFVFMSGPARGGGHSVLMGAPRGRR